jgi:hypothetical protein
MPFLATHGYTVRKKRLDLRLQKRLGSLELLNRKIKASFNEMNREVYFRREADCSAPWRLPSRKIAKHEMMSGKVEAFE